MIIKTFTAESSAAALKQVREEMSGDAVVLKSLQTVSSNGKVIFEVTACLEKPTVAQSMKIFPDPVKETDAKDAVINNRLIEETPEKIISQPVPDENWHKKISEINNKLNQIIISSHQIPEDKWFGKFREIYFLFKEADFGESFILPFMSSLISEGKDADDFVSFTRGKLVNDLSSLMLPEMKFQQGDRLVFLGPAGNGKSSVMGKLAALLVAGGKQKVKLASLDNFKMAAFDELSSYAEILGVEITNLHNDEKENAFANDTITLIDTPAIPFDIKKIQSLKEKIDSINPDYRFVVLSCLTRSQDVFEFFELINNLKPTHIVMTMQDLTNSYGAVLTAAKANDLKIAFITNSPGGIGSLKAPDPDLLARKLLKLKVLCE